MPEQKLKEERKEEYDEERKRRELERKKREKEEKKGVKKVSKVESPAKSVIQKTTETEVKVPILKLEKPKIEIKEGRLSKGIPHIEREELEVKVPVIRLFSPVFEEREIRLNKDIPSIETIEEKALKIPLVKLRKAVVKDVIFGFNSNTPTIRPKLQIGIRTPIYRILRTPIVKEIGLLDKKIDEKLLEKLEERRRTEIQKSQISAISGEGEPSLGEGEEAEEETPEFLEFVFGGHPTQILAGGPIIVLYKELEEDSTIGSFETLCERIFRERKGGKPGYLPIQKLDDFNIREIEKYIKPEGNIVRIDLDLLKKDAKGKKRNIFEIISPEYLRETLGRFIVGDVSFLIFKTRDKDLYDHCKQILRKLSTSIEHPLRIVEINPQEMTIEQKRILTELAWGVLVKEIDTDIKIIDSDRPIGTTLDDIFNKFGRTKHEEYLKNLQKEEYGIYAQATNQHEGEESELHLQIKWFIVKFLSEKYKLTFLSEIEESIKTEERLPEVNTKGEYIKPDVWDVKENAVYEVETLFSEDREGRTPQKKIYESIKKYEGTPVREINIVLDNLTFLLHIRDIFGIKRNIKDWENKTGKTVNFLTLNVENYKLVSISKIFKKYKSLEQK